MLDSALLRDFIDTFNGYGDYHAPHWLVGMEEGGGGSLAEITRRLTKWHNQGRGALLDLMPQHADGDLSNFASGPAKLQATWSQLIRVVLAIEGKPADKEAVRLYQQTQLGRFGGDTCLIELMPLPSPSTGV